MGDSLLIKPLSKITMIIRISSLPFLTTFTGKAMAPISPGIRILDIDLIGLKIFFVVVVFRLIPNTFFPS